MVNLNPLASASELKFIMETTGLETLITFDMMLRQHPGAGHRRRGVKRVIVTRVTDYITGFGVSTAKDLDSEEGWHHFSELIAANTETRLPRVPFTPDDPALIQFTGGTTGVPKGALLTHANIVAATLQASLWGNPTTEHHPAGKAERPERPPLLPRLRQHRGCMNWAFFNCATQILVPRFEIDELLGIIGNFEKIIFFPTVPTLITALINHPKAAELNLDQAARAPQFRRGADAGGADREGAGHGDLFQRGVRPERIDVARHRQPRPGDEEGGEHRHPLPGQRCAPGRRGERRPTDVKPGEPGEIIMKGPLIMKGYWNNPEETAGQLRDGWLHTGDIAQADEDGYLFIVDRKKDMIIAGGFNIYPREIDEVLYQHPKVQRGGLVWGSRTSTGAKR